jgi:general secretion pathway protein L
MPLAVRKSVLGLDLGSHSLKAVEIQQSLRGIEVVQLRAIPRGAGGDPVEAIQQLLRLHRLATDCVVAAIPGDAVTSRRLALPFRDRRKLTQAVPFAVEGDLPFDLEQVLVDWEITGGDRSRAEVTATIAPRAEVSRLLACLEAAGCPPRTLEAEGLALANLAGAFDLPAVCLLADVGHRKTTLCLLVEGRGVAARCVRVGGLHLSEALAKDLGIDAEQAEQVKCAEGIFGAGRAVPHATAVLERLAREILLFRGSHEEVSTGSARIEAVVLCGGSAQLADLDRFLADRTGIPTSRLGLPRLDAGAGLVAGGSPVLFAPAIALALRGTSQARTRTNFRQDEFALRLDFERMLREFRWSARLGAACLALAALAFAIDAWTTSRRAREIERASLALYGEILPGQPVPENTIAKLRDEVAAANERAAFLGVYRGNLSALDVLSEISRLVPADLDVVLEELSIDRQTVRMRVFAKSFEAADRLGAELGKFAPFSGVRIGSIETDAKTGAKRFNVTISLGAEAESRA